MERPNGKRHEGLRELNTKTNEKLLSTKRWNETKLGREWLLSGQDECLVPELLKPSNGLNTLK
ncbi:hypothetical protein CCR75_008224 [Bremia lactucae]|uniref:Uncharacterized protein n=1 Tax=Bremia lactucae TaxID=4779 RepID=A0A976FP59_BRELC|nr:hypothetical protein CCR75_008224 [Bremia lactucae]